jgi:ABC-type transport system substrate-binding protein
VCRRPLRQCRLADVGNRAEHGQVRLWGYADIDELYKQQAVETDHPKREALLHQIQRLLHERMRFGPICE